MPVLLNPHNYDLKDLIICDDPNVEFGDSEFTSVPVVLKFGCVKAYMLNWNIKHKSMQYFRDQPDKLIIEEHCIGGSITDATYTVVKVKDFNDRGRHYIWCLRPFDMASK